MNIYTIVTNDAYELPVLCDVRVKEAAEYLHTTPGGIQRMICRPPKRSAYKPVITGRVRHDSRRYYRNYSQTHDRTEYFRQYYQSNKSKIKERRKKNHEKIEQQGNRGVGNPGDSRPGGGPGGLCRLLPQNQSNY